MRIERRDEDGAWRRRRRAGGALALLRAHAGHLQRVADVARRVERVDELGVQAVGPQRCVRLVVQGALRCGAEGERLAKESGRRADHCELLLSETAPASFRPLGCQNYSLRIFPNSSNLYNYQDLHDGNKFNDGFPNAGTLISNKNIFNK